MRLPISSALRLFAPHSRSIRPLSDAAKSATLDKTWQPPYVALNTNKGEVVIELFWQQTPKTCRNFAELAHRKYYDGTIFHRIIQGFVIQGGDPTGTGRGGTSIYGASFADEFHKDLRHSGAGILSMANAGPNTNGSQFFITLAATPHLDGRHSVFGKVHTGMDVVKKIAQVRTDRHDRPIDEVKITSAEVRMK